ncbi:PAS-domain containing protein [Vannielia litorea]|uniref:PAS-domain containing protein n=1 Tax=Vannielia litorea TaxID=1217970 RepID=UPI001C95FACD|nr:PAS-domain containing protein [Vannielia litorea]MBY6049326.1 PAS-domain containing protein [Vannielia litorea]MBY6076740.1 PAS-domain containing protein [Vannielia litorea]
MNGLLGELPWAFAFVLVTTSFGTALLAMLAVGYLQPKRRVTWDKLTGVSGDDMTFLFEDDELVDASEEAHVFLASGPETLPPWPRFLALLAGSFPDIGSRLGQLAELGKLELRARDGTSRLDAELKNGLTRFSLHQGEEDEPVEYDSFAVTAMAEELDVLRTVVDDAPVLAWREDEDGNVTWANGAYIDLLHRMQPRKATLAWPLPRAISHSFHDCETDVLHRVSITIPYIEQVIWYDCSTREMGEETLVFAVPADRLVQAERSRIEFLQTLTKTFADLPTGLAVFDRGRQLALFNPALTDLSSLEPHFLSSRPTLVSFLDHLREAQRMPEPKDYKSWRASIAELESAASEGMHQEIWSLPTGQTYRVTGQPHPDGAVAFLFEDISAEMSLTRRFRSELEMGQAVVDSLDEAIAVFAHTGSMVLCNRAYQELWNCDLVGSLSDVSAQEAVRDWSALSDDDALWTRATRFLSGRSDRRSWSVILDTAAYGRVTCRFAPVAGGAALAGFKLGDGAAGAPERSDVAKMTA